MVPLVLRREERRLDGGGFVGGEVLRVLLDGDVDGGGAKLLLSLPLFKVAVLVGETVLRDRDDALLDLAATSDAGAVSNYAVGGGGGDGESNDGDGSLGAGTETGAGSLFTFKESVWGSSSSPLRPPPWLVWNVSIKILGVFRIRSNCCKLCE